MLSHTSLFLISYMSCWCVHLNMSNTACVCSHLNPSPHVSQAAVTSHFTGHWQQRGAHLEAGRSLLNDSFAVLQDSVDLSKWCHQRHSVLCMLDGGGGCSAGGNVRRDSSALGVYHCPTIRRGRDGVRTEYLWRAQNLNIILFFLAPTPLSSSFSFTSWPTPLKAS